MDTSIKMMRGEDSFQCLAVAYIRFHERNLFDAQDLSHTAQRLWVGVIQIIHHQSGMACLI